MTIMEKYYILQLRQPNHFHSAAYRHSTILQPAVAAELINLIRQVPSARRNPLRSIFIKEKEHFRKIDFQAILFVEAAGSYCRIHLAGGRTATLSFTLSEITPRLDPALFLRVHRSYIVNIDHIDAFIGNTLCIDKHRIPVSKQHRIEIMEKFNILGYTK